MSHPIKLQHYEQAVSDHQQIYNCRDLDLALAIRRRLKAMEDRDLEFLRRAPPEACPALQGALSIIEELNELFTTKPKATPQSERGVGIVSGASDNGE